MCLRKPTHQPQPPIFLSMFMTLLHVSVVRGSQVQGVDLRHIITSFQFLSFDTPRHVSELLDLRGPAMDLRPFYVSFS